MGICSMLLILFCSLVVTTFLGLPLIVWTGILLVEMFIFKMSMWMIVPFGAFAIFMNAVPIRRAVLSSQIMAFLKRLGVLPEISKTEKIAID